MKVLYFVSGRADKGIVENIAKFLPGTIFENTPHQGGPNMVCYLMGNTMHAFSTAIQQNKPDMVLLVGDRYETFAAAGAATIHNIPIAHVHGGETTEGANDDAFRNAITKMADVHLTANEAYRARVIQMGEDQRTVFAVGAPGLDGLEAYRTDERSGKLIVTFHPVTRENDSADQFQALLDAFPDRSILFTGSNADVGGQEIDRMIDDYCDTHKNAVVLRSMRRSEYLSELAKADAIVGNSSSGIIEAPFLHVPSIDIGNRQRGRMAGNSVIRCSPHQDAIKDALSYLKDFHPDYTQIYGDGHASDKIAAILEGK